VRAIRMTLLTLGLCAGTALAQPPQAPETRYSADGLYNLANAYARAGEPGLAVLNYERAALLAPGDADIRMNLEYVRAAAHLPQTPSSRFAGFILAPPPILTAWIGVLGIVLIGSAFLAARMLPRSAWLWGSSISLGVALAALAVSQAALLWPRMHAAVVLVNQTPARVSPVPMGDTAFLLPEGETVTLTARHESFALIRTRDGLSGWVAGASLGTVLP
jgi:hypothetical protein